MSKIFIGTAAWAIPREHALAFPQAGKSALERYSSVLSATEINTTFYRRHRASTFERWRDSVPGNFRFAVKLPKAVTHNALLRSTEPLLAEFFADVTALGDRLGPVLAQLPPWLEFERSLVEDFYTQLRKLYAGPVVCEPRHASFFAEESNALMIAYDICRAAVDPSRNPGAERPGGSRSFVYNRLHGSPHLYYSAYGEARLEPIAKRILEESSARPVWCIFDNTASGAAALDALLLKQILQL